MKKLLLSLWVLMTSLTTMAQGWPSQYEGVMLQGFYWDSFNDTKWTKLQSQASELARSFKLVWIPQSGNCNGTSMGYDDYYWFPGGTHYSSSFGTETQLRNLITTFKNAGIGTIADVVVNHRRSGSGWFGFPTETYQGVTYSMTAADVCRNDDGGKAKTEADKQGVSLGANDTGEDWDGMRDLDHTSTNVQNTVKAYVKMLLDDLGYAGFRYDMVKGFSGTYVGMYNAYAQPEFSVGEYWDGNVSPVTSWMRYTKIGGGRQVIESAAFDFPFRYTVRDAVKNKDWTKLANASVASQADYRRYAVTFVENHDTEYRSASNPQDPIQADTLAANAWLLAYCGTPCVFLKHWQAYKREISSMIAVRNAVGVHNESEVTTHTSQKQLFAAKTVGKNGSMMVAVGNDAATFSCEGYTKVLSGHHFAYFMDNAMETAWVDAISGSYYKGHQVTLTAVTQKTGATLVYTLDGSTPTASSTSVASGTTIEMPAGATTVLTVGILANGAVSGIVSRTYEVSGFAPFTIDVYVNTDQVSWTKCNFHSYGGDGTRPGTSWPGTNVTDKQTIGDKTWFHEQYTMYSNNDYVQLVFSTGTGSPQTVDSEQIKQTTFLEVLNEKSGTKYKIQNVTTGIEPVLNVRQQPSRQGFYTLDGRFAGTDYNSLQRGIYVTNGKKVVR
jgi:alpha-amylase